MELDKDYREHNVLEKLCMAEGIYKMDSILDHFILNLGL